MPPNSPPSSTTQATGKKRFTEIPTGTVVSPARKRFADVISTTERQESTSSRGLDDDRDDDGR